MNLQLFNRATKSLNARIGTTLLNGKPDPGSYQLSQSKVKVSGISSITIDSVVFSDMLLVLSNPLFFVVSGIFCSLVILALFLVALVVHLTGCDVTGFTLGSVMVEFTKQFPLTTLTALFLFHNINSCTQQKKQLDKIIQPC